MTTAAPTAALATIQPVFTDAERVALAGFPAEYRGLTREAYALLAGLLECGRCGRRLESAWSNGKPAYRCRHGPERDRRLPEQRSWSRVLRSSP
jgi:Recombinase zinc beta ribbon domain